MDTMIASLISTVLAGGPQALTGIVAIFAFLMWTDRNRCIEDNKKLEIKLDVIASDYSKANVALLDALHDLRNAIYAMRAPVVIPPAE